MLTHKIYTQFLNKCIILSSTLGARSDAYIRTTSVHDCTFFWHKNFNPWTITDKSCKSSLDFPENHEYSETYTINNKTINLYTTAPLQRISLWGNGNAIYVDNSEAVEKDFIKYGDKNLIGNFLYSRKKLIVPTHKDVNQLLKEYPNNLIINLWCNKENWLTENRFNRQYYENRTSYWKPINHPRVFNVAKDKYFSDSFKEFEDEYRKFINYFEIKQLHTNKIRAFILRYLEKGNQYIDIDRINSAKVKHWSQRNA